MRVALATIVIATTIVPGPIPAATPTATPAPAATPTATPAPAATPTATPAPAAVPTFDDCARRLAAEPDGKEGPLCYYEVAVATGRRERGTRLLKAAHDRHPDSGWILLRWANLEQRWDRAQELYRAAIERFRGTGNAEGEIRARGSLGQHFVNAQRYDDAGRELAAALAVGQSSGDALLAAIAGMSYAQYLFAVDGDLGAAHRLLRDGEAAVFPSGDPAVRLNYLLALARVETKLGRTDEATATFRRLLELSRVEKRPEAEPLALLGLVETAWMRQLATGHPAPEAAAEQLALARQARDAARAIGDRGNEALAERFLGDLSPGAAAEAHYRACLAIFEELGVEIERSNCLRGLADSMSGRDPGEAFRLLDLAVAHAREVGDPDQLADVLWSRASLRWKTGPRDQAVAAWQEVLTAIEATRDLQVDDEARAGLSGYWADPFYELSGRLAPDDPGGALTTIERLRARLLLERMEAKVGLPATLERVQGALAADEALLSFQLSTRRGPFGDDDDQGGSWLIVVTATSARSIPLPDRAKVTAAVDLLTGLIERRDGSEAPAAAALHRELLAGALAGLPPAVDKLILIPDGMLHLLPFAVLGDGLLLDRYRISIVPSATIWLRWRDVGPRDVGRARLRAEGEALVLADPTPAPGPLGPLPHARAEGRAVVDAVGGRLVAGAAATRASLSGEGLRDVAVLHFATHATVDDKRPSRTAVQLADGPLDLAAITTLPLNRQIVVLSACRSAGGAQLRGEGVLGLAQAFFQAHAAAVVGSLWPLRDDEAALLFGRVYRHLAAGAPLATAVQTAQRESRAAGAPAAAWAGLVVLGDGDIALTRRARTPHLSGIALLVGGAILAAAALTLAAAALRHRRHHGGHHS